MLTRTPARCCVAVMTLAQAGCGFGDYHRGMTTATLTPSPLVPLRQDATVIGLVGLAHASSHFAHLLLPPLFPVFIAEFGLSYSQLGLLMSTFFVVSGVGQACAGFVVDRLGARSLLFVALGIFMVACVGASVVHSYAGLLTVAALAGLGNATFHPVDFTILNQRVSAPRLGYAFSAHGLTGNLGWAAAPVFLAGVSALSNWRTNTRHHKDAQRQKQQRARAQPVHHKAGTRLPDA